MDKNALYKEILRETGELVKQTARNPRRTVALSPEVAQRLERIAVSEPTASTTSVPDALPVSTEAAPNVTSRSVQGDSQESTSSTLADIAAQVQQCTKCALAETRIKTVFGEGSPHADLVFVGEAPGADEDRTGHPFVGRAGQLLTDIIEKGFKMRRDEVFICNVLKCRPPGNRNPSPDEVLQCEPYLVRQLEILRPKVICALGGVAATTLLKTDMSVGRLRGSWHNYHNIPLRVTYHPAYLLRNENDKGKAWADVKEILRLLRGEVTPEI